MTNFFRYRPVINGFIGGPGINTWHGEESVLGFDDEDPNAFAVAVWAAYNAMKTALAPGVSVQFPTEVTWHLEDTGEMVETFAVDGLNDIVSEAAAAEGQVPRAAQFVTRLSTGVIRRGRKLQGRHFIGPASARYLTSDGQVTAGARTFISAAYGGLIDSPGPNLVVWGPPIYEKDGAGNPTDTVLAPGKKGTVTTVSVSAVPGTLRSRKV